MSLLCILTMNNEMVNIGDRVRDCEIKRITSCHKHGYKMGVAHLDNGSEVRYLTLKGKKMAEQVKTFGLADTALCVDSDVHCYIVTEKTSDIKQTVYQGKRINVTKLRTIAFNKHGVYLGKRVVWV